MSLFGKASFIFKHDQKDSKDSISVLGEDSKFLCSVFYEHSWKMPQMWGNIPTNRRVRATDVRIEAVDGVMLGEIHENPTGITRLIRKWEVLDQKGAGKGVVVEKPKFIGSDWVLEDVEGNLVGG